MPKDILTDPLPQGPQITGQATQLNPPTLKTPELPQVSSSNFSGSGLIGSAVGVVGNLIGDQLNYNRQKKMYETQRKDALSDYERQRSDYLSDLASERAYNSPAAQRARLLEAGINPNVAFGNGNVANTSSDAQTMPNTRSSLFPSVSLGRDLGSGIVASGLDMVRARDLDSQTKLREAEMLKIISEIKGIDERTKSDMIKNGYLDFMYDSEIREREQHINESLDRMESAALDRVISNYELHNLLPAQKAQIQQATSKLFQETRSIIQQIQHFKHISGYDVSSAKYKSHLAKLQYDFESVMNGYVSEMEGMKVPSEAKSAFGRIYRRAMHEAEFVTKSALGWFSGSYMFGTRKK